MASSSSEDDEGFTYDQYEWDLQPSNDVDPEELLSIVFRPLNFRALSSIGRSPMLVSIHGADTVAFRICYGGEDDDFDSTFGTDLAGKTCSVSGLDPKNLKNFSVWLRDASGASEKSTVVRLPRPLCRSALEMWEHLQTKEKQFMANASSEKRFAVS